MLHRLLNLPILVLVIAATCGTAQAQSRVFVGARNVAMGGTGVGGSSDALAVHYNPAGMAFSQGWEVQVPLTADAKSEENTLSTLDELRDLFEPDNLTEIQDRLNTGRATPDDLATVLSAFLGVLPDLDTTEDGAVVRAAFGPSFRWKNWGASLFYTGTGGIDTLVDLSVGLSLSTDGLPGAIPDPVPENACGNNSICQSFADRLVRTTAIDPPRAEVLVAASGGELVGDPRAFEILRDIVSETISLGPTLADNPSEVTGTGILIGQAAFTYSRLIYQEKLSIGVNAKLMTGRTFFNGVSVADFDGDDDVDNLLEWDDTRTQTELGLDLGVMYRPYPRWSFGLAANNINTPSFDRPGDRRPIELEPLLRAGLAYRPLRWFNLAFDVDLNEVDSGVVRGLGYRYANFGAEFLAGRWFAGRVGVYENLGFESARPVLTGGLGFVFRRFSIELAVGAAAEETTLSADGSSVPSGFAASLQFNWRPRPAQ